MRRGAIVRKKEKPKSSTPLGFGNNFASLLQSTSSKKDSVKLVSKANRSSVASFFSSTVPAAPAAAATSSPPTSAKTPSDFTAPSPAQGLFPPEDSLNKRHSAPATPDVKPPRPQAKPRVCLFFPSLRPSLSTQILYSYICQAWMPTTRHTRTLTQLLCWKATTS